MTNFNSATKSFDLCTEGTSSYAWAWENLDRADCVGDMKLVGKTPEQFARDWANTLLKASIDQINPEGERGFTAEEIETDLHDDVQYLATALQAWLEAGDDDGDDQEPQGLLLCTSSVQRRGMTPASEIYVFSSIGGFRAQNPHWNDVEIPPAKWHGVTIIDTDLPVEGGYQAEWGGNPTRKSDGYTYYP